MADYSLELWYARGGAFAALPVASNIVFIQSIDEGDTVSFSLDGRNPTVRSIREMHTDVVVYREGQKQFRGRIISAIRSVDPGGHTVNVTAVDYKALLRRRFWMNNGTAASADLETHAWNAIAYTQARTAHSSFGITRGSSQAVGVSRATSWEAGTSIRDYIDALGDTNSAEGAVDWFEWTIDPELEFRTYKPHRGRIDPEFTCDYGGSVMSFEESFDPNAYANNFTVVGNGNIRSSLTTTDASLGSGAFFEEFLNDGSIVDVATADATAFWLGTFHGQIDLMKTYNLEIASERWGGPGQMGVGDRIHLDLRTDAFERISDDYRVRTLYVEVDESGMESVAAEVAWASPARWREFSRMNAFMRHHRTALLASRAKWYNRYGHSLKAAWSTQVRKHGKNSYEAKAARRRYDDWADQYVRWKAGNR